MKYDSSITDAYKWRFLGGAHIHSALQTTNTQTNSGTYVTLDSSTPQVTLPTIGIYRFTHRANLINPAVNDYGIVNVQTNGTIPGTDQDAIHLAFGSSGTSKTRTHEVTFQREVSSISTSALAVQVYRTAGTNTEFDNRQLSVVPVRLG